MTDYTHLIESISILFETYLCFLFFTNFFKSSINNQKYLASSLVIIYIFYNSIFYFLSDLIFSQMLPLILIFAISFLFKMQFSSKMFFSFLCFSLLFLSKIIVWLTLSILKNPKLEMAQHGLWYYFENLIISQMVFFLLILLLRVFFSKSILPKCQPNALKIFLPIQSIVVSLVIFVVSYKADATIIILCEVAVLIMLISTIISVYIVQNQFSFFEYKNQYEITKASLISQVEHYNNLAQCQAETRKIRHDLNNNLTAISGLLSQNKTEQALEYIHTLTEHNNSIKQAVDHGLPMIDAILNDKINKANDCGVTLIHKVIIERKIFIDQLDIAMALATSLDNAIEAAVELPNADDKIVQISLRLQSEYFSIVVKNKSHNIVDTKKLKSKKSDRKNHGFGIPTLKQICSKYYGDLSIDFNPSDYLFTLKILLKNSRV